MQISGICKVKPVTVSCREICKKRKFKRSAGLKEVSAEKNLFRTYVRIIIETDSGFQKMNGRF